MKRLISLLLTLCVCVALLGGCGQKQSSETNPDPSQWPDTISIELSDSGVKVNGETAPADPTATVYTANDIVYYEEGRDFTYGEGTEADAHSAQAAAAHTVVHITQPGSYVLSGTLSAGQVAVDLGEDAEEDPSAVVTLILNGVDITCTVAPAVIFYNVYECGSADAETATKDVDTSAAGANILIADGTANTVNGSYVARIYKPDSVELNEDGTEVLDAKKLHKYDAAFYSKMSMNVDGGEEGTGALYINAENEGLDSELHLTVNGGIIDIRSGNDGINTNEDGVSVTTINGGALAITVTGETGEGDGIDSNGWLVINGGSVVAAACANSADSGIDSDMGIHINGGFVMASGHVLDRIESGGQNYMVFNFARAQSGGTAYTLKSEGGKLAATYTPANDFSVLLVSADGFAAGGYTLWQGDTESDGVQMAHSGTGGMSGFRPGGFGGQIPEGFEPPEGMEPPESFDPARVPEGIERPEGGRRGERLGFEGMERNEDGTITMPEGTVIDPESGTVTLPDGSTIQFDAIGRPEGGRGSGGMGGFGSGQTGEASTVFTLTDGGAVFSGVMPASEAESVKIGEGTEVYPVIIGGSGEQESSEAQS